MSKFAQARRRGSVRGELAPYMFAAPDVTLSDNGPLVLVTIGAVEPAADSYEVQRNVLGEGWAAVGTAVTPAFELEDEDRVFDGNESTVYRARGNDGGPVGEWGYSAAHNTDIAV